MKQFWGAFRVIGLALVMLGVAVGLTLRQAEAKLTEALRGFGDELASLHDMKTHSAPRTLMLNGLELKVLTASTPLEIAEALSRFQSLCHTVGQIDLPKAVRQKLEESQIGAGSASLGTIRKDAETEGFLACLDVGDGLDAESFLLRLKEFGTTQNLRSLGQFRYVQARRAEGRTTLVVFWLEGDVNLREIFPKTGDAPGVDLKGLPRPKDSQRVLSAFELGMPSSLAFYSIPNQKKNAAFAGYQATLRDQGWQTNVTKNGTLVAEKAGRRVLVRATERNSGSFILGLFDLG